MGEWGNGGTGNCVGKSNMGAGNSPGGGHYRAMPSNSFVQPQSIMNLFSNWSQKSAYESALRRLSAANSHMNWNP